MSKQAMIVSKLAHYYKDKEIPSQSEHEKDPDAPFRVIAIRRYLGPWSRVVTKVQRAIDKIERATPLVEEVVEILTEPEKTEIVPPKPVAKKETADVKKA